MGQNNTEEMTQQHEQINQLELELTISQEKHRTCQKEVMIDLKCIGSLVRFYSAVGSLSTLRLEGTGLP